MKTRTRNHLRGIQLLKREIYLSRVDLFLDGRAPGRRRKEILQDLRNSIATECEGTELRTVLIGLGEPRVLAASYAEGSLKTRALWTAGVVAALLTLLAYGLVFFSYTLGMLAVAAQVGGEFTSHFFVVEVMAFSTAEGIGVGWGGAMVWLPFALAAIALLLASRPWRLLRRSTAAYSPPPGCSHH